MLNFSEENIRILVATLAVFCDALAKNFETCARVLYQKKYVHEIQIIFIFHYHISWVLTYSYLIGLILINNANCENRKFVLYENCAVFGFACITKTQKTRMKKSFYFHIFSGHSFFLAKLFFYFFIQDGKYREKFLSPKTIPVKSWET